MKFVVDSCEFMSIFIFSFSFSHSLVFSQFQHSTNHTSFCGSLTMVWHNIFCISMICAAAPFTCSLSFSFMYHSASGKLPWQDNQTRTNIELESATSPWTIGPQSQMRYHWKLWCSIFMLCGQVTNSMGFGDSQGQDYGTMTSQPNKIQIWSWKCHISMNNRTPKSNEVSLESSEILLLCCEGELPTQWALETLKVKTMVPWLHKQPNKSNFELESATSPWTIGSQSWMRYHWKALGHFAKCQHLAFLALFF
jgi:hypothetical protein